MGQITSLRVAGSENRQELAPVTHYIPEEVLVHILSYVSPETLLNLRLVNKLWKHLIDKEAWRLKVSRHKYHSLKSVDLKLKLPWYVCYVVSVKDPFERNLLRNHCGQDKLKYWKILSEGGNKWAVEDPPEGCDPLPRVEEFGELTSCFATSYHSCSKEQAINLKECNFSNYLMDNFQPDIEVSEWFTGRFDCGCIYEIRVDLVDESGNLITHFAERKTINQWEGREWIKVSHVFQNYGPGVRKIIFYHGGVDTQFWAGHYGSKMSGACVKLKIPSTLPQDYNHGDSEVEDDIEDELAYVVD